MDTGPIGILAFFMLLPVIFVLWGFVLVNKKLSQTARNASLVALSVVSLSLILIGIAGYHAFFLDEPLCMAAEAGDTANVKSLLEQGANPNGASKFGAALSLARSHGHEDIVNLLTKAGAHD